MVELSKRPMLDLIASHGEWVGRSVESVLELNGFTVLRVAGGRRARRAAPTSELQPPHPLMCRLLLPKKKTNPAPADAARARSGFTHLWSTRATLPPPTTCP